MKPQHLRIYSIAYHIMHADLLKVIFFARSEFSLIKFCAELCTKIAIKTCKIWRKKNLVKLCQKYEKVPVLQVPRSKL